MEQHHNQQPETSALVAQLEQLIERSRWYSSRLKLAKRTAVEALAQIEQQLGLQGVTEERRGISSQIQAFVFVASLTFLVAGVYFVSRVHLKTPR